ncbi:uncharacterized protein LOC143192492 isoform X1 [Rhynchophorus ferrugineus]|uniref:uncharacterized protein LOC143192492 isoform X1 n=1 Tax=Rhynchophorus ferrugineus TaxID=354439 RepID=UPI003FCD6A6A
MSCTCESQCFNTETVEETENLVNETIEYLNNENARRTKELYGFIDDFVNSEEYSEYVKAKQSITKETVSTQYDLNDIIVQRKDEQHVNTYSLTEEQKKMYAFKRQFEKYTQRKRNLEIVMKQEKSIQIIREKIDYAKKLYTCTRTSRLREIRTKENKILQKYSNKLDVDLTLVNQKTKDLILQRLKSLENDIRNRRTRRQNNLINILEKLTSEQKLKREMRLKSKMPAKKSKWTERIIKGMEIVGKKIELKEQVEEKEEEKPPEPLEVENKIESPNDINVDEAKKTNTKKTKKPKENKKAPKKQKPVKTKDKTPKKKLKKADSKFELPAYPVINPRQKITAENLNNIIELIEEFQTFDGILEEKDLNRNNIDNNTVIDLELESKPTNILFQNFDEGKCYNRRISVYNRSAKVKKFRFQKFLFENPYDEIGFRIDRFGIVKLYPGCSVSFTVYFTPFDKCKAYRGTAVFLSYNVRQCRYYKIELKVMCVPKCAELQVKPNAIQFGKIPIWRTNSKDFKIIKLHNNGEKQCTIYIKKNPDPLDLDNILADDDDDYDVPEQRSTDDETLTFVKSILNECLQNINNTFSFEQHYLTIEGRTKIDLKVFFRRPSYVGNYFEKYLVNVYDGCSEDSADSVSCQEISVYAETTDIFISVVPAQLDFGTCHVNSCYRLNFEVINSSNTNQAISVRVPQDLSDMIEVDVSTFYLRSQERRVVWLKFFVCEYIFKNNSKYFSKSTSILEFPIHLNLLTKSYQDYPTLKIPIYAILTNSDDITISTNFTANISNFLNTVLLDMGTCSVCETVYTDLFLINNTYTTQICGFLNLPECIKIEPNYGFIKLFPNQRKKIRLYLSPEIKDYPSYYMGNLKNSNYYFKLVVDTLFDIGHLKRDISVKKLRSSVGAVLSELSKKDTDIMQSVFLLLKNVTKTLSAIPATDSYFSTNPRDVSEHEVKTVDEAIQCDLSTLNIQNFVIVETDSRKDIWCRVTLKQPLVELSHQLVEFPDTPCSSYSMMNVTLNTLKNRIEKECDRFKKDNKQKVNITANFKFTTDSAEISIEPKCGQIKTGQSIKLNLLSNPSVPKEILEQTAKSIKYQQIYDMKLKEYNERLQKKSSKHSLNKNKKGKAGKSTSTKKAKKDKKESTKKTNKTPKTDKIKEKTTDTIPTITVTDSELTYDYLDMFPAEMVYWRNMDPYYITANFTCHVSYEVEDNLEEHQLFLTALCRVVRPEFITDLNLQRIDFGKCAIGMSVSKKIVIQNIKYDNIKPKVSVLNPLGPFSIPCKTNFDLPPEHYLNIPLKFTPTASEKITEYFEIRTNSTVLPLILCGEGFPPNINITPEFTVYRLETKSNRLAELSLKIENQSEAEVDIKFIKLFEIVSCPEEAEKPKETSDAKTKTKKEKKPKDKDTRANATSKFSNELNDSEIEAINAHFQTSKEESHFYLNYPEPTVFQPHSQNIVIIYFGAPELLEKKKSPKGQKVKGTKGKGGSGKSSEKSSGEKTNKKISGNNRKQYISQYNIFAGNTFLKCITVICSLY